MKNSGEVDFPCRMATTGKQMFILNARFSPVGGPEWGEPGYRQLATVLTLVANAVRAELGCEDSPFPLPDNLTDEPPPVTSLTEVEQACDTFDPGELGAVLPNPGKGNRWHAWKPPGNDFPATGCEIWRKPRPGAETKATDFDYYTLGPMLSFTRLAGFAGENLNLPMFHETMTTRAKEWGANLGGDGYAGSPDPEDPSGQGDYNIAFLRDCDESTVSYLGRADANTVDRTTFDQLFEQWIRAQAKRDGCPIKPSE